MARLIMLGEQSAILVCGVYGMKKSDVDRVAKGGGRADEAVIEKLNNFSMLHPETLRILWEFSALSSGPILELGPYMGGSTIAMALASGNKRVVTIERGGAYLTHPHLPTSDIVADLKQNLALYGVDKKVSVIEGSNEAPTTIEAVRSELKGQKAGLVFMDSDGQLQRDFPTYRQFITEDAFVVFDDYESEAAADKAMLVRPFVQKGIKEGYLIEFGVYKWGTWVGQFRGTRSLFSRMKAAAGL